LQSLTNPSLSSRNTPQGLFASMVFATNDTSLIEMAEGRLTITDDVIGDEARKKKKQHILDWNTLPHSPLLNQFGFCQSKTWKEQTRMKHNSMKEKESKRNEKNERNDNNKENVWCYVEWWLCHGEKTDNNGKDMGSGMNERGRWLEFGG